jgi:hypothetical protein
VVAGQCRPAHGRDGGVLHHRHQRAGDHAARGEHSAHYPDSTRDAFELDPADHRIPLHNADFGAGREHQARTLARWTTGVDGFTVTTNIDVGIGSTTSPDVARELRRWTALPVAVSGGFSTTDSAVLASPDWEILIMGRCVVDAADPVTAAKNFVELVHLSERRR